MDVTHISTMVEEKLVVSGKTSGHGHHNKSWAHKTASHHQSQTQSHDSNNNVPTGQSATAPQKKVVTTTSVAVTAVPGRSPLASPKVRHEQVPAQTVVVNGSASVGLKAEPVVQKANAILQTDAVPQQQQQKKLETNTVSVTATPAAINGVGEKPQAAAAPATAAASAPSSWASLFASSQKQSAGDSSNGPLVGSKKPVAKVLPFEGTQVSQASATNTAGTMSYSAASSMGLSTPTPTTTQGGVVGVQNNQKQEEQNNNTFSSLAERRGYKLGGELVGNSKSAYGVCKLLLYATKLLNYNFNCKLFLLLLQSFSANTKLTIQT